MLEDAQIVDAFVDGGSEWLSIATSVSIRNEEFDKANQFAMLHAVARLVYLNQQKHVLECSAMHTQSTSEELTSPVGTTSSTSFEGNSLEPLLRMCGSQLQRMKAQNKKKLQKLKSGTVKHTGIDEQQRVIDHLCMTSDEKKREVSLLPSMDRGGMEFPKRGLFPFLQRFDSLLQQELNYKNFEQQGKHLFKVNILCSPKT